MAGDELKVVRLRNEFYRDGFYKAVISLSVIVVAIILSVLVSLYLYFHVPPPVTFHVDKELRVLEPVPITQQYVKDADLLQWVADVMPNAFTYDFVEYNKEVKNNTPYFTVNGWKKFNEQLNVYANSAVVQKSKLFITTTAAGAPYILSKGLLNGRYSWWVQMPATIQYNGTERYTTSVTMQILVVRVPTVDDLSGLGIENLIILKGGGDQTRTNG